MKSMSYIDICSTEVKACWLMEWRFFILCLLIFVVMCFHTKNGQWTGDFWEHSAVVRELATHILHPKHPQLLLDAPHAFYSPYNLIAAILVRMLHSDAITVLSFMGLVNLSLLFLGIRIFTASIVSLKHRNTTAFYTLLLTLFWWGYHAWGYSGFFHIGVLGYVLPYPSTFAEAFALIALGMNWFRIETNRNIWCIPIFLIAVIVLISHAITFLFLAAGLVSQSLCAETGFVSFQLMLIAGLLSIAFFVSLFWHYFSVIKLLTSESSVYHSSNRVMYQQIVSRIWPALLGVPLFIASMNNGRCRSLVFMMLILCGIYIFGATSGKYSYGRVISYIVLLLHIIIAEHLSILECKVHKLRASLWFQRLIIPASVTAFGIILSMRPLGMVLIRSFFKPTPTYNSYLFLSQFTHQYDVILSDIDSSWIVPTFGGKIVAAQHPLAFVPDHDVRRLDTDQFFDEKTEHGERQLIIEKYQVNYLLIKKMEDGLWQSLTSQGKVEYKNDNFILIRLKYNQKKW